uniref:Uncharacterized protein n=1 Tax=Branchiostoma floridae TaxID=7739 RepID=C3YGE5_BRAFL|eukprot:XP_002604655.1 hypothetical protein BRAFLDRAFT_126793 [Branchiostoma floridae]
MYLAAHLEILTSADAIIELGSGPGLAGIAAAKLCGQPSKVFMTDHNENVLELLQENIDSNFEEGEDRPTCEFLDWNTGVERFKKRYGTFDVVLGADIVYSERTILPMLSTARALLAEKPSSVFLLVYVGRLKVYDDMFRECSTECQLHCTEVKLDSIPGASDIRDDSAMLHKIRVIVLRHKEFLDRSLDLLVAETREGVETLKVEDTDDNKLVQPAAEVENPGLNDGMADESKEYDRFPIADHSGNQQSPWSKEPFATVDGHDECSTIIDETIESPTDCKAIVPLKDIAAEALIDAAEESAPAKPNCSVRDDNGKTIHNHGTDSVGCNSQAESNAKNENDLSVWPGTETAPAGFGGSPEASGKGIPKDGREMPEEKSQMKEEADSYDMDIPVISTTMAVSEAEEKPPIVNGALTADELPSIQVTSKEDVVSLTSDVETEKMAVGSVAEDSGRVNVDDFVTKSEESSQNDRVVCSELKVSQESASSSNDTTDEVFEADRSDDLPNETGQAVGIFTSQTYVSNTETVGCEARDRFDTKVNQDVQSTCVDNSVNGTQSDDITMTKSEPLSEELSGNGSEISLFTACEPVDKTSLSKGTGSMELYSDFGNDDEINYHVHNGNNETRFDTDKNESVDSIAEEQCQAVPDDSVSGEDKTIIIDQKQRQARAEDESFERDSVTADSIYEEADSRSDQTEPTFIVKQDNDTNYSEEKAKVDTSHQLETKNKYQEFDDSDLNMSLYSAMMHLVLIPTFVFVVMFLVSFLVASVWFQIFFNT